MMIRLLIADDERLEREALVEMVSRRFEHEVVPGAGCPVRPEG